MMKSSCLQGKLPSQVCLCSLQGHKTNSSKSLLLLEVTFMALQLIKNIPICKTFQNKCATVLHVWKYLINTQKKGAIIHIVPD